jgi:hypothetical protein
MKKIWVAIVILVVAAGIYFWANKNAAPKYILADGAVASSNQNDAPGGDGKTAGSSTSLINSGQNPNAATDLSSRAASPNSPNETNANPALPAATVLDNARVAIHNYAAAFGENPVGNNAEITAALTGKNPKQINFISAEAGLRMNAAGELLDAYGTPFFFHQLSGKVMEIHSAGEDRKMWTFDDLVTK